MQYSVILDKCFDLTLKTYSFFFVSKIGKAYFRKARHTCGINKKGHIFVNLGRLEDEIHLNNNQI